MSRRFESIHYSITPRPSDGCTAYTGGFSLSWPTPDGGARSVAFSRTLASREAVDVAIRSRLDELEAEGVDVSGLRQRWTAVSAP